jgi:hypothetical protein
MLRLVAAAERRWRRHRDLLLARALRSIVAGPAATQPNIAEIRHLIGLIRNLLVQSLDYLPARSARESGNQRRDLGEHLSPHERWATPGPNELSCSPVAVRPGEGHLTKPTAGVQPQRPEPVFMPLNRPSRSLLKQVLVLVIEHIDGDSIVEDTACSGLRDDRSWRVTGHLSGAVPAFRVRAEGEAALRDWPRRRRI